jgi:hypothetical protein
MLDEKQKSLALSLFKEYQEAKNEDGTSPEAVQKERDGKRLELIQNKLLPLVNSFLKGEISIGLFKSQIDSLNKRNPLWGFSAINGQMFFNMLLKSADSEEECSAELKAAIAKPDSDDIAKSRLKNLLSYVNRLGEKVIESGGSAHSKPRPGSIPFFVSYFWQIQAPDCWPVYYNSSVTVLTDNNWWQPSEDLADNYIQFKQLHEELAALFGVAGSPTHGLYDVEHVFWYKGGNPTGGDKPQPGATGEEFKKPETPQDTSISRLSESYVPPIIAVLSRLSVNDPETEIAAKNSGISVPRAFEKYINAAFTLLGYETKLLGQGGGRVPDGLALDVDNSYALIWDAKVRKDGYSLGTDDRVMREYITTQSRELKRKKQYKNIYYLVISSSFSEDFDETVRFMKMETDVNEVCLVEAEALIALVDFKLRTPKEIDLGPMGIQRIFCDSGIITAETVRANFS